VSSSSNIDCGPNSSTKEDSGKLRILKVACFFVLVWPLISNLVGVAVFVLLEPSWLPFLFRGRPTDLAGALVFIYLLDFVPAAMAGTIIGWVQLRPRRLNPLYILFACFVAASIAPLVFIDKDTPTTEWLIGNAVSLLSAIICWVAVHRWFGTMSVLGESFGR
jgi:peptidoglycan/LPS O-acetylase OafA/YrhL